MHKLTICTGWSPSGWEQYARYFVKSFERYAAPDIRLLAYVEDPLHKNLGRAELVNLWDCPGVRRFVDEYKNDWNANGRKPRNAWKQGERDAGYSFRWDAVKFCRQGYIPLHAAGLTQTEMLAWFDADVVFTHPFKAEHVTNRLPNGKHIAYLGRAPRHSEIGFQLYRLPEALPHLQRFRDLYDTGAVFALDESHSAYVFDRAREQSRVPAHDMTPNGKGNVWTVTPLAAFSTHLKGERKSRARTLVTG